MSQRNQTILTLFQSLSAADQAQLIAFAEFLLSRTQRVPVQPTAADSSAPAASPPPEPEPIPRPEQESVVKAVKRLSKTYPMLDKSKMLSETSELVAQHIMQGRDAVEVIDELERVFQRFYQDLKLERSP